MSQTIDMVVTVKAYPQLSARYGETVCVAGVRTDTPGPSWVRLYPVVYRDLHYDFRFAKYQRITLEVSHANDPRPEPAPQSRFARARAYTRHLQKVE